MTIGIMEVTLLGARDLKNTDCFGRGSNPVLWNEKFTFKVEEYPVKGKEHHKLVLKLMDRCSFFNPDGFLGQTVIYLKELFEIGVEDGKAELSTKKYRVVSSHHTYNGEIKLGITFTAKEENAHEQQ